MLIIVMGLLGSSSVTANILQLEDGEACNALGGGLGTCKLLSKCTTAGDFKNNQPPICSFRGKEKVPIICCTDKEVVTPKQSPGLKVLKVCNELRSICRQKNDPKNPIVIDAFMPPKSSEDDSGIFVASGVGGIEVQPRGHPYMVERLLERRMEEGMEFQRDEDRIRKALSKALIGFCGDEQTNCDVTEVSWGCGGSLISPRYVLSAAHCALPRGLGPAKWARLGDLDISTSEDDAKPVDKRIVEILVYPQYSEAQVYHDIALFKLESDVVFNGYILPVCLQTFRDINQKKANFTGWGRTGFADPTSDKLLEGEVEIYNETECRRLIFNTNTPKTPLGLQPDLMICAGVPDGSKDACTGDSGGPLITGLDFNCLKTQVGITSYGNTCGLPDSPGVYTRVSNYIPWIEEIAFKDVVVID